MAYSNDVLSITSNVFDARWNAGVELGTPVFVTFSFGDSRASYDTQHPNSFTPWSEAAKAYVRQAFQIWDQVSGIHFIEVPDSVGGQIRVTQYDMTGILNSVGQQASGFGYYPGYQTFTANGATSIAPVYGNIGGDLYFNANYFAADPASYAPGQRGFSIALHEVGHTIGFKHSFEGTPVIEAAHDNQFYTVMSYNRVSQVTSLGSVDIEASQIYYGASDVAYSWDPAALTLVIAGSPGAENFSGTELTDFISGAEGADVLRGGPSNDRLDGGADLDTALYARVRSSYSVALNSFQVTVSASIGNEGVDNLVNVERLKFLDGTLAFDTEGNAGQMYRLYQAAFDRTPDTPGLGYWIKGFDSGSQGDLAAVAKNFILSNEFKGLYGTPATVTDDQFIGLLYANVLDRTPDAGGLAYWKDAMAHGYSRERVLASFSESVENKLKVSAAIQDGIFYT